MLTRCEDGVSLPDVGSGTALSQFSATYDQDGNLVNQTYPNGLVSTKRFDNTGNDISLGYAKNTSTWLSFTQGADAQGRTVRQSSPASSQVFGYDPAGRLVLTKDTVNSAGITPAACTLRAYTLDKNSNRTQLQSYPSGSGGACSTSTTPTTTSSSFDAADRITTTVPAADAVGIGSHATLTGALTVGYYANDLVASQTQGGTTQSFTLDPLQNRVLSSTTGSTTTTSHYSDGSDSPAWTSTSASVWTRNLTGIDGSLVGTIDQTGVLTLDLANLHGDIVATAADNSNTSAVSRYSESTEYGAPRSAATAPDTYGWLGAKKRSTNDLGGLTLMGVRLYNPTTGRFLSVDPVPGGNDNPYIYVTNPTDMFDLDGNCHWCPHFWGVVSFFSARGYVSGGWALAHRHYRSAWNNFLGVAVTGAVSAGLWYGGRPGVHRNTFSGTFKRFARGAIGRTAGRLVGWPVTLAATGLDYGHSWWNAPRRHTHVISGYRNGRGQVY